VTAYADETTLAQAETPQPLRAIRKPFDAGQLQRTLVEALAGLALEQPR
jgi:hypothetical protein